MGKVVIVDPSLEGEMSHHYFAASALAHELDHLGLPWAVVSHADASGAVLRLRPLRHFRVSGYHHAPGESREQEMESTALCNAVALHDLLRLDRAELEGDDLVFFPAVTANLVLGIAQWLATFPPRRAPAFGLCLMFQLDWHVSGRRSDVGELFYRQAFPFVPAALRGRVVYTCETDGLAAEYEPLVGARPLVAPIPTVQHLLGGDEVDGVEERPVAFLGYAKAEKGFHLLPDVVARVRRARPHTRFVVQVMGHDAALIERVTTALRAHGDAVRLVEGPVAAPRMVELMRQSGLVLLPYDPATYRTRGSAIFTEARSVGRPMVLPARTAIGDEGVRSGLAEAFDAFDAPGVADAVLRALTRREALAAAARREARRGRAEARGYLRPILEACGLRVPPPSPAVEEALA
jgi:glycosyltransferase involved in cell wall biosynthesis